ncbi:MAG: hypothetical protein M5U34_22340 [Chloroflexi bacterium]|nr:hypothetical protein [Chloroflexota bacterium]
MNLWRQWQALKQNPVYLRETGAWGPCQPVLRPDQPLFPLYHFGRDCSWRMRRQPESGPFAGNDDLFAAACFICLPGFLITAVTLYAQIMAPASPPPPSAWNGRGHLGHLRTTPLSLRSIFMAKLFGSLSRLRIWTALFALTLLQGGIMACSLTLIGGELAWWGAMMGLATTLRPWLEIIFAAFVGMYASTLAGSVMMALVGAYSAVVLVKLFNSGALWLAVSLLAELDETLSLLLTVLAPIVIYLLLITAVWFGLFQQAKKLRTE